jgi:signal transduction histidine kinase
MTSGDPGAGQEMDPVVKDWPLATPPDGEIEHLRRQIAELERELTETRQRIGNLSDIGGRFLSLVENLQGAVFYRGRATGEVSLYGRDRDEITGVVDSQGRCSRIVWYRGIHRDDFAAYKALEQRRRRTGEPFTLEFRYRHPDTQRMLWLRERAFVVDGPHGERFYDGFIEDITAERERERKLKDATESSLLATRSKSEFLANVSHELRTPLNAIVGFADMFVNQAFGPLGSDKYVEYSRDIHHSATYLQRLINDILDVSKAESGKVDLQEGLVDLGHLINSALRMVRDHADKKMLVLATEIDEHLPQLRADEGKMRQILINLLSNAVKFTEDGGRITVRARERMDGGMTIAVADTGIGIEDEDIPRALEPFVQLDTGLSRQFQGTGLGLPLASRLTELHGGRLDLQSRRGVGTVASVVLPQSRCVRPRPRPAEKPATEGAGRV